MTAVDQISPAVKVNGRDVAASWYVALVSIRIEHELNVVGRVTLRFADSGYQLSATETFKLGASVEILAPKTLTQLFLGDVTGASLEQTSGHDPELVVTAHDAAYKLGVGTRTKTYEKATFASVTQTLAGECGLTPNLDFGTAVVHEYLLQQGTDLAFIDTLCQRANCVWWMEGKQLNVAPVAAPTGEIPLSLDRELREFSVRASALRPSAVGVNGRDVDKNQDLSAEGAVSLQTATSTFAGRFTGDAPKSDLHLTGKQLAGEGNPNSAEEAKQLADSLATTWHASAVTARGTLFVNEKIKLLTSVHVTDAGPASGKYTVSRVEHVFRESGFLTRFVAGPLRPAALVDTLGAGAPDPGFELPGVMSAIVSDAKDPEGLGRVKIKFVGTGGGELSGNWARVLSLGGGLKRGSFFLPEVGDEVLVGFERGDARHPVVLGGLFSQSATIAGDDKAIDGGNGSILYRRITSRLGHFIELGDGLADAEQHILLQLAGAKHKVRLGADEMTIDLTEGKPFTLKAGAAKIAIDATGNITIEGASIKLKATQTNIEMEAPMDLKGKASAGSAALEGLTLDLKAQTNATVQAEIMTAVKGATVMIN